MHVAMAKLIHSGANYCVDALHAGRRRRNACRASTDVLDPQLLSVFFQETETVKYAMN